MMSDPVYKLSQSFSLLIRCSNVEEYEFICALSRIECAQLNRITCITEIDKIRSLNGASIFYIETWYDSFCEHDYFFEVSATFIPNPINNNPVIFSWMRT